MIVFDCPMEIVEQEYSELVSEYYQMKADFKKKLRAKSKQILRMKSDKKLKKMTKDDLPELEIEVLKHNSEYMKAWFDQYDTMANISIEEEQIGRLGDIQDILIESAYMRDSLKGL